MDRLFHRKLNVFAKGAIVICSLLSVYFFWEKRAVVGLFLMIIVIGMIERVVHTTYTFRRVKPIDKDEEYEFLIIDRGRFSHNLNIPVVEITNVSIMKKSLGLDHCILLEYGQGNVASLQPEDDDLFIAELNKRKG